MAYGKLIGGKLIEAPNVLNKNGKQYINPPEGLYLEYGYLPLEYTTIPNMKEGYHLVQSWVNMTDKLVQIWNYETDEKTDNSKLQKEINKLKEIINSLQNQYVNTPAQDFPEGDYMNPILLMEGGVITVKNKWYYVIDKDRPHRAIVEGFAKPDNFYDKNWFDFV